MHKTDQAGMAFALVAGMFFTALGARAASETQPEDSLAATRCNDPVYMVVSGTTLDPARMGAYGAKLAETGIYAEVGGYYLNTARPIAVFQGDVDPRHATLIVRFPCLENARKFWNSKLYQEVIKPLRENPSAGDYTVTVYREAELPGYMRGKVRNNAYSAEFSPGNLEQMPEEQPVP